MLPGWSASAVHVDLAPITIVSLAHGDGQTARWIIAAAGETYNEPIPQLPRTVRDALRAGTRRRLQDMRDRGEAALAAWSTIPRTTRLELLADLEAHAGPGEDGLSTAMGGRSGDSGQVLPVCSDDNLASVVLPAGVEIPILREGTVLRRTGLQPGWAADTLYRDFAPFYLLELQHEAGV